MDSKQTFLEEEIPKNELPQAKNSPKSIEEIKKNRI